MPTLIESFFLSRLHREEDLGFHGLAYERIKNIDDTVIAPHIQQYKTAIDDFDKALKQELASLITGEIKELDFQIGLTYHGLRDVVNRMLRYTNESKAAAARKIDFVVRKYDAKTNPALLALVEQTEVFQNMIADLKDPAVFPFLSTVGAKSWFEDLDAYNTRLSQLYSRRTTETSVFVAGLSKECRTNVDKKYREIVEYINTMIRIKQTGQYEPVVPELNRLVDEMKIVLAERKTTNENRRNRNLKLAGVDDIPVQIYTGSPVYPPFQLFLNGNLLAPGVDYTAAYKNNVNPGTATVTVAGKGATIGKKEITFNIERTL